MKIGSLNRQIQLQYKTISRATDGSETETWVTQNTVWASKAHQSSREFFSAQKINAETTDLFIIRYRKLIDPKMRVVFDGKNYNIIGTPDPDGKRRELHLLCREVL